MASLLAAHYDPRYGASARRCFPNVSRVMNLDEVTDEALDGSAGELMTREAVLLGERHP